MATLMTLGCQRRNADEPPQIRYGRQACDQCRMLISEERFAAAAVTQSDTFAFDSIECLIRWLADATAPRRIWVHDYDASVWLDGRAAWFVRSPQLSTPMGGGLIALAAEQAATESAKRVQGEVLRFEQLAPAAQTHEAISIEDTTTLGRNQ